MPKSNLLSEQRENISVSKHFVGTVTALSFRAMFCNVVISFSFVSHRDESILGISMGPMGSMGFPWEWESLS